MMMTCFQMTINLRKWCYSRLGLLIGKVMLWKWRCLCKGWVIEIKPAILFCLPFSMFGFVCFFACFNFWFSSLFRVDFFIPGVSVVGGFSMCSSPGLLEREGILELAVKYTAHPPAHWIHTEVNKISCWLWHLALVFHFLFLSWRGWGCYTNFCIYYKTPVDLFEHF